ncbi:MAG: O-methyltransferase, partial [Halobacterium sp.]
PELADGGVVVADNMMAGPVETADVTAALEGADPVDDHTEGVAAYIEHVRDDDAFDTAFVPLGEGVALSVKTD